MKRRTKNKLIKCKACKKVFRVALKTITATGKGANRRVSDVLPKNRVTCCRKCSREYNYYKKNHYKKFEKRDETDNKL